MKVTFQDFNNKEGHYKTNNRYKGKINNWVHRIFLAAPILLYYNKIWQTPNFDFWKYFLYKNSVVRSYYANFERTKAKILNLNLKE